MLGPGRKAQLMVALRPTTRATETLIARPLLDRQSLHVRPQTRHMIRPTTRRTACHVLCSFFVVAGETYSAVKT
jgi:hypothetical protein